MNVMDTELIEEFVSFPDNFVVMDGNTSFRLTTYLRTLVVTEENIRYIYLIISKSLHRSFKDVHFNDMDYFSNCKHESLNEDFTWLRNNIDINGYIGDNVIPELLQCMDSIRYLILLSLNTANLILSRKPIVSSINPHITNGIYASEVCWRISKNTNFNIIMEKINPWSEYDV